MIRRSLVAAATACVLAVGASQAYATTILTDTSLGYYNAGLGTTLDGTSALFPIANGAGGDPTIFPATEPNLAAAAGALGAWLSATPVLNAPWTAAPVAIPKSWAVNTETAIVFAFTVSNLTQLTANIGVDNGIFVWVDGVFKFGALAALGSNPLEYPGINLGLVGQHHYLQILREDHGGGTWPWPWTPLRSPNRRR